MSKIWKEEFQICQLMDFDNILYVEYLVYNNNKNEIVLFIEGCYAKGDHLDVHPPTAYIWPIYFMDYHNTF